MSISLGYLLYLIAVGVVVSWFAAGVLGGKGSLPGCLRVENWTVTSGVVFILAELPMLYFTYLQATGQMATMMDVFF